MDLRREEDGAYLSFVWPGGYPLIYIIAGGEVMCAACANNDENTEDPLIGCDVFWEGRRQHCVECNDVIDSAYGGPDAELTDPPRVHHTHPDTLEEWAGRR